MEIKKIHIKDLEAFVLSDEYLQMEVVPISKIRAISHANNPLAKPEDVALVLIYVEGKMEAYLGVLPDEIYPQGKAERCGWLSCMWVNPNLRGRGLAKKLINTVFEAWGYRILVTEFTPEAKGLYDSTKQFLDLAKPNGVRGYMRSNLHRLLPKRNPRWERATRLLKVVDAFLNFFMDSKLWFLKYQPNLIAFPLSKPDSDCANLIKKVNALAFMRRGEQGMEWMSKYPWLTERPNEPGIERRYHFSTICKKFKCIQYKLMTKEGEIVAYLMISVRDGAMKVPYLYAEANVMPDVAKFIFQKLLEERCDTITVFHPLLRDYICQNKGPFFLKRQFQRHYIISKVFGEDWGGSPISIQDGDADCGFT